MEKIRSQEALDALSKITSTTSSEYTLLYNFIFQHDELLLENRTLNSLLEDTRALLHKAMGGDNNA